jgi:hypothetical protein
MRQNIVHFMVSAVRTSNVGYSIRNLFNEGVLDRNYNIHILEIARLCSVKLNTMMVTTGQYVNVCNFVV